MNLDEIWNNFLVKIKSKVSLMSFNYIFKDLKLYSYENSKVIIVLPSNELLLQNITKNYHDIIEEIMNDITNDTCEIEYIFDKDVDKLQKKQEAKKIPTIEESDAELDSIKNYKYISNFNSKYTFDTFVVGESNKLAYGTALAVAQNPGKLYNPYFIYAKSGLGKTHLMHAIGNYIIQNTNKKVLYVSSEQFVNDYIAAVRNNEKNTFDKIDSFKNKYRNIDVLIIDDIQFLGSATKGQEEFFHTFNQLHDSNKQIIIASDRSVDDLKMLENRLITRFNWGLTANITPPDFGLRVDIIKRKIAHQEAAEDIPIEVIEYIANINDSDVRQLEGAITRVFAYALMMNHGVVTLDIAIEALKDKITLVDDYY